MTVASVEGAWRWGRHREADARWGHDQECTQMKRAIADDGGCGLRACIRSCDRMNEDVVGFFTVFCNCVSVGFLFGR